MEQSIISNNNFDEKSEEEIYIIPKQQHNKEYGIIFNPLIEITNFNDLNLSNYNESLIQKCIMDLFVNPRKILYEWSCLTEQTNHTKIGYTGQHLASVILNIKGCKTGARGNDCIDGTEVKSCSRVDQSDKCDRCKINLLRLEKLCPNCNKDDKIIRNNDSKWLLTIRDQEDLNSYLNLDRLLLIIEEYPDFDKQNYNDISITIYEIYPKKDICSNFPKLITSYFSEIYSVNLEKNLKKVPSPKNFWPHSFQFHMCNPFEIFKCQIKKYLTEPEINIIKFIKPNDPRTIKDIAKMPISLLNLTEKKNISTSDGYVSIEDKLKLQLR
jgi:hypothetical protein